MVLYPRSGFGRKIFVLGSIRFNRESIDSRFLYIVFHWQTKQIVVYLQEGGSVGYSTANVSYRSRKGVYCYPGATGVRQALETMIS